MSEQILTAIIAALSGIVVAYLTAKRTAAGMPSRKISDHVQIVDSYGKTVTTLHHELDRFKQELDEERQHSDQLEKRVRRLERALREAGIDPFSINGE